MRKPSFNDQQSSTLKGMVAYWSEVDTRDDRDQVKKIANSEVQSLLHVIPAITILRIVAEYTKSNLK